MAHICSSGKCSPSKKVSTPNGKNLLPLGANSSRLEYIPFWKGCQNEIGIVASLECVSFTYAGLLRLQDIADIYTSLNAHVSLCPMFNT